MSKKTAANIVFSKSWAESHRRKRVTYRKFSATYEIQCFNSTSSEIQKSLAEI